MEISRTTKLYISTVESSLGPILDYGSRNGELAELTGGFFADHRLYNRAPTRDTQHVAKAQDIIGKFNSAVLTAQFSTELNLQLAKELLFILQPEACLYLLLPAGYTPEPYSTLCCTHRVSGEPGGEQIIELRRQSGAIDTSEKHCSYTLNVAGKELSLEAGPGVFSPEALDAGTAALLEVLEFKGGRVLDLACGNGVMGIWAKARGALEVTMLDADLRALRFARKNTVKNSLAAEVVAGDGLGGMDWHSKFDYILCNPPYHSDYSVARGFIEGGYKALSVGGSIWFVVKNPQWYREKMKAIFGGARVIEHNGYAIVMAEKRDEQKRAGKQQKTTRKHEKRMARVGKGK